MSFGTVNNRGRPAKAKALKVVEGTFRKDRENPEAPQVECKAPEPPKWLTGRAKKLFIALGDELERMRVVSAADGHALALAAEIYDEFLTHRATIKRESAYYETTNTQGDRIIKKHPVHGMMYEAWSRLNIMLAQFGLTPNSRAKLRTIEGPKKEEDGWDNL